MSRATAEAFCKKLGGVAVAPHAEAQVASAFSLGGIRYERLNISGAHGEIPAYALYPESATGPCPGLLALHSHDRQFDVGKSGAVGLIGDPMAAIGLLAAQMGFAVIVPDLPGFEDNRPTLAERKANYAFQGENYERLLTMNALVEGRTLQARISSDLLACVSVLAADPRVDSNRLFAAGHSFGGQEAIWAALLDERLKGCLSSCGFSLVRTIVERSISHNMALYVPGLLPDLDFDSVLRALCEKRVCLIAAEDDRIYPVDGVRSIETRLKQSEGLSRSVTFRYAEGPHAFRRDLIGEGLAWLALGRSPQA